jgi:hypothetical protein
LASGTNPAIFIINGDAIAAELTIMNFLLLKLEISEAMDLSPLYVIRI